MLTLFVTGKELCFPVKRNQAKTEDVVLNIFKKMRF